MEKVLKTIGAVVVFVCLILVAMPLSVLCGAAAGWFIGLFFGPDILYVVAQFHIHNVTMWQLGAFGGFFSSFLRTQTTVKAS